MKKATKNLLIFEIKNYIAQHYIQNKESDWLEIRFSLKDGAVGKNEEASSSDVEDFISQNNELFTDLTSFIEKEISPTFVETLLKFIGRSGKKDSRVYKDAGIDRRLFSKMMSDYNYSPSKPTVLAFALSLELKEEEALELLKSAGYTLSTSDKRDVILSYCYKNGIYKLKQVNEILYVFNQYTL